MQWDELIQTTSGSSELDLNITWLVPLQDYTIVSVEGERTMTFLQGQCTCDVEMLNRGSSVMGAHCNHKGRMHSTFIGAKRDENTVLLRFHSSIAGTAQQQLFKYAALSRVKVEITTQWRCFAVVGPQSEAIIARIFKTKTATDVTTTNIMAPPPGGASALNENCVVLCHARNQYEMWCCGDIPSPQISELLNLPKQRNGNIFRLLNMQRGIAELEAPLVDSLLPQEINFQFTNAISFSKGCYTGQEIIARLHYKGQMRKHMYLGTVETADAPTPGTAIQETTSDGEEEKNCGLVINSVTIKESDASLGAAGCSLILALCDDNALESASLKFGENRAIKIQWNELPYAISKET